MEIIHWHADKNGHIVQLLPEVGNEDGISATTMYLERVTLNLDTGAIYPPAAIGWLKASLPNLPNYIDIRIINKLRAVYDVSDVF